MEEIMGGIVAGRPCVVGFDLEAVAGSDKETHVMQVATATTTYVFHLAAMNLHEGTLMLAFLRSICRIKVQFQCALDEPLPVHTSAFLEAMDIGKVAVNIHCKSLRLLPLSHVLLLSFRVRRRRFEALEELSRRRWRVRGTVARRAAC